MWYQAIHWIGTRKKISDYVTYKTTQNILINIFIIYIIGVEYDKKIMIDE